MPFGCEGGIRLDDAKVAVVDREMDYHRRTLDMSDGRVVDYSEKPVERERLPADARVEISNNNLKPLQPSLVRSITPAGFDPVVVTDRFIFAKRTWWSLAYRSYVHHGEVVVVDRTSRSIVWRLNGSDITVQASPTHVVVCGYGRIATFLPQASRPQEITDFYSAIRQGDVSRVAKLFPTWRRTPLYDLNGNDPLTLAAKDGQPEVVRKLLALKLSPNTLSADGYSPLLMALNWDHAEIVGLLLPAGADPNDNAKFWDYPLTRAAESSSRSTIEVLLKSGAKLNATDRWQGQTALHAAVMYRNYEAVQALLDAHADRTIRDDDGKTAIEMTDRDECISHLFAGGRISEEPVVCAPPRRSLGSAVTFDTHGLIY